MTLFSKHITLAAGNENMKIFILYTSKTREMWDQHQMIAAETEELARKLAKWDYDGDETAHCDELKDVTATGDERVLFRHYR